MIRLAGAALSTFQWSTSEQLYPFEKGPGGEDVYCCYMTASVTSNSATFYIPSSTNLSQLLSYSIFFVDAPDVHRSGPYHWMPDSTDWCIGGVSFSPQSRAMGIQIDPGYSANGKTCYCYAKYTKA